MTILFVVNNIISYFLSPLIGKGIIRFGERKVLSLEYTSLVFIFTAYALTSSAWVVAAIGGFLWVVDYRIPFFGGSALAAISLMAVQKIRMPDSNIAA